jgi:hypothetical protein
MTREEAVAAANKWVREKNGVAAIPFGADLIEKRGRRRWSVAYDTAQFFHTHSQKPAVVDGPYIVVVDDATGEVSVLG